MFLLLVFGALQIIAPTYTRDTFQTIKILCKIKTEVRLPNAFSNFFKILNDKKMQNLMFIIISDAIKKSNIRGSPKVKLPKALPSFLKILSDKKMQNQIVIMISEAIQK